MGKSRVLGLVVALALVCAVTTALAQPPAPDKVVNAYKTETAPEIDGRLDEPMWERAEKIDDFTLFGSKGNPSVNTEAWLATDGRHLYVAVRSHDPDLGSLVTHQGRRDGSVHNDDSVELFIDPGTQGRTYFHFVVNARNTQADQIVTGGTRNRDWDAEWESAVYVDPLMPQFGWTVEMAFPMRLFRQVQQPRPWRVNIGRNKRTEPVETITWADVQTGFHDPENFGTATGLLEARPDMPFAPIVTGSELGAYRVHEDGYAYEVSGTVANEGGRRGTAVIEIVDKPRAGAESTASSQVELGPVESQRFSVLAAIDAPGERAIVLNVRDADTGDIVQTLDLKELAGLNPLDAYPARDYFTSEETARILAVVAMPAESLEDAGLRVEAALEGPQRPRIEAVEVAQREVPIEFSIAAVPQGEYKVRLTLVDSDDVVVGEAETTVTKHAPAPEGVAEVKIDKENRCLLVDGEPFFPIGICALHRDRPYMELYREIGYNTLIRWAGIGRKNAPSTALASLNLAHEHGIYMIDAPLTFLKHEYTHMGLRKGPNMIKAAGEVGDFVKTVREHPALLAYYSLDEAPASGLDEGLRAIKENIKALDPYHPVYISGGSCVARARYDFADILGSHDYWGPLSAATTSPISVANSVRNVVRNVTEPHRKPLLFIPQNEITSHSRRPLSPAERRVTVFLAVINGAKSCIYFASPLRLRATVESMKEISGDLNAMAPAILKRTPPQEYVVTPHPEAGARPYLQAVLKDHPEGGALLIAANARLAPVKADWDLSDLGDVRVSDFLGEREFDAEEGRFSDMFEPFGVRTYRIEGGSREPGGPAVLRVQVSGGEEPAAADAPAAENVLPNGDFAEGTTGWSLVPADIFDVADAGQEGMTLTLDAKGGAVVRVTGPDVELEPGTSYRYGARVRTELTEGTKGGSVYVHERRDPPRLRTGIPFEPTHGEWTEVDREFTTPAEGPVKVGLWYSLPADVKGKVHIAELFIEKLPEEAPKPKNMLVNSSFEVASVRGWPDGWWIWDWDPLGGKGLLIGDEGASGQDDAHAWHGKYSCKVNRSGPGALSVQYKHPFASSGIRGGIPVEVGKTYTLSMYMRADRPNTPARVTFCNFVHNAPIFDEGKTETFRLTNEWKRYHITLTFPATGWQRGVRPDLTFQVVAPDLSEFWIDAVQVEEGNAPTEYVYEGYQAVRPPPDMED